MITLVSHGHKFGQPDANYKFDVSFFSNPWRDPLIKKEEDTEKRKQMVLEFMQKQEGVGLFVERVCSLIRLIHVLFPDENHVIAFCCSAGEYRSPVIAELVAKHLKSINVEHKVVHHHDSKI